MKKTIITILIILIAAGTAAGIIISAKNKTVETTAPSTTEAIEYDFKDEAFNSNSASVKSELYPTGLDNIFYSKKPIAFFELKGGKFSKIPIEGTFNGAVTLGGEKKAIDISYISTKQGLLGIGEQPHKGLYDYTCAVLRPMPAAFNSSYKCILLINTVNDGKSVAEKTYSEIFPASLSGEIGSYLFNQNNRTIDETGKLRSDWDFVTLQSLNNADDEFYSFSGKKHSFNGGSFDLCKTENGRTEVFLENIAFPWYDAKAKAYIKEDGGKYALYNGGKAVSDVSITEDFNFSCFGYGCTIREIGASLIDFRNGYLVSGNYSFKDFYSFFGNDGRFLIAGKEKNKEGKTYKVQKLILFDEKTESSTELYFNDIMDEKSDVYLSGDYIVLHKGGSTYACNINKLN